MGRHWSGLKYIVLYSQHLGPKLLLMCSPDLPNFPRVLFLHDGWMGRYWNGDTHVFLQLITTPVDCILTLNRRVLNKLRLTANRRGLIYNLQLTLNMHTMGLYFILAKLLKKLGYFSGISVSPDKSSSMFVPLNHWILSSTGGSFAGSLFGHIFRHNIITYAD